MEGLNSENVITYTNNQAAIENKADIIGLMIKLWSGNPSFAKIITQIMKEQHLLARKIAENLTEKEDISDRINREQREQQRLFEQRISEQRISEQLEQKLLR